MRREERSLGLEINKGSSPAQRSLKVDRGLGVARVNTHSGDLPCRRVFDLYRLLFLLGLFRSYPRALEARRQRGKRGRRER